MRLRHSLQLTQRRNGRLVGTLLLLLAFETADQIVSGCECLTQHATEMDGLRHPIL